MVQQKVINLGLWLLRTFGRKKYIRHESPAQIMERRLSYIDQLIEAGYTVNFLTQYQIRINNRLDIYPKNARWHDIKLNKRGGFEGRNLATFVRKYFKEI